MTTGRPRYAAAYHAPPPVTAPPPGRGRVDVERASQFAFNRDTIVPCLGSFPSLGVVSRQDKPPETPEVCV